MIFHRLLMTSRESVFRPTIVFPEHGDVLYDFDFIEANSFTDAGGSGIHWFSEWQVANDDAFTDIVDHITFDEVNLTDIMVGDLNVEMLSSYFVRVRYATHSTKSEWSEGVFFETNMFEEDLDAWSDSIYESSELGF